MSLKVEFLHDYILGGTLAIKYHPSDFPIFQTYVGHLYNYITFLVLRFYDDFDDFKLKLNSLNGNIEVYPVKRIILTGAVLYNRQNNIRVELSRFDDYFTNAVKLLHVLFGDDFINMKVAIHVLVNFTDDDYELYPYYVPQKMV